MRQLLGAPAERVAGAPGTPRGCAGAVGAGLGSGWSTGGLALGLRAAGYELAGATTGPFAGVLCVALLAYALPKRGRATLAPAAPSAGHRSRRAGASRVRPAQRSRVRPHATLHMVLGLVGDGRGRAARGPALSVERRGRAEPRLLAGGAWSACWARLRTARCPGGSRGSSVVARCPRIWRAQREALVARLYRDASGQSELVKTIVDKLLLPYPRRPLGALGLVASGRSLREEERRLRARVEHVLEGRGGDRLDGLDDVLRTVVELRALPARRALTRCCAAGCRCTCCWLRSWLVLLVLHVLGVVVR